MIQIVGPRLSQWDTGRRLSVTGSTATHVHIANRGDSHAPIMDIVNGEAKIPDYLLQNGKELCVYLVMDGITQESKIFSVQKRERPENYVYEDDRRNYIYELITGAQEATTAAYVSAKNANDAAGRATSAANYFTFISDAYGADIHLNNAAKLHPAGLRIFGKTTQDGTPTPENPVQMVNVGASGSITVNIAGETDSQSMVIATPNGLPGIPVTTGGNYTDANGKQWVCDEIDFARGVYVKRINVVGFNNAKGEKMIHPPGTNLYRFAFIAANNPTFLPSAHKGGMCNALTYNYSAVGNNTLDNAIFPYFEGGVFVRCDRFETVGDFIAWAISTGLKLQYILATPIETPLSEEELASYAALHTYRGNTTVTNDASAYMVVEYAMDAKKYIDGIVISGCASARISSITLRSSAWGTVQDGLHSQVVSISGITQHSKVDLLPSVEQLAIFHNKDVAFVTENEDGIVTVFAIGDKPTVDYTMQVQITEVLV